MDVLITCSTEDSYQSDGMHTACLKVPSLRLKLSDRCIEVDNLDEHWSFCNTFSIYPQTKWSAYPCSIDVAGYYFVLVTF